MAYSKINVVGTDLVHTNANGYATTIALATKLSHSVTNGVVAIRMASELITEPLYNLLVGSRATPYTDDKTAFDALDILLAITLPEYDDNAAAVLAGLTIGKYYRTGDAVKIVHA